MNQIADEWWQKLAGTMFLPEWQALGGVEVPVSYVLDLYAPSLDRKRVIATVNEGLNAYAARAATVGVPSKDEVLTGARNYRALPKQAFTDYNRKDLNRMLAQKFKGKDGFLYRICIRLTCWRWV